MLLLLSCWANTPPSALDFVITPEEPGADDDLVAEVTVQPVDADGDQFAIRYQWYRDGELVSGADSDTVSAELTDTNELWRCEALAYDGTEEGLLVDHSVTIGNSLPIIQSLDIAPEDPRSDQDMVAVWDAYDQDGDNMSEDFVWKRDGIEVGGLDGEVVPAEVTSRREVWTVELTVKDQHIEGATASAVATIGNAPPTARATLGPEGATTTDNLVAEVSATDPDGDEVSFEYAWYVDGIERSDWGAGSAAPWTVTTKGDSVRLEVVASDESEAGDPVLSDALVIANSPPSIDSGYVYVTPSNATGSSTLVCNGVFLDDDDDPIGWQVRWFVDGTQVSTATNLSGAFSAGDEVSCGLTPDDGEDLGDEAFSGELIIQ